MEEAIHANEKMKPWVEKGLSCYHHNADEHYWMLTRTKRDMHEKILKVIDKW